MLSIFKRKTPSPTKAEGEQARDRREGNRVACDLFMNRFMNGHPYLCVAVDVSRTGMLLRPLSGPVQQSGLMGLQFQLPGSDQVFTASGEKVWSGTEGVAVRFKHLGPGADTALHRFLQSVAA